ncbi:hypothetical protein FNH05_06930 [Amycolatopsis rhizosphaerae]|uniref:Uncharacterized protein n=1 Tax=Amycolatopsis rhizosphaerae TaxID=2053003 RepID=A0A558D9W4_9PSEU|nr:hypothetical protein [Amycolatopsis rhizosphaerae]TVT57822.1 hypothetical protein FNH05_06930 [Amycolatopsis rhizosphaerae]
MEESKSEGKNMPLLTRLRARLRTETDLVAEEIGHALLVHGRAGASDEAQALAVTVAEPELGLVVADLPSDSQANAWEALAVAIPKEKRGIRLVLAGPFRESGFEVGQWLSARLDRTVVAADGRVLPAAGGGLFVTTGQDSRTGSWVRFQPGQAPEREGSRFPRPAWESAAVTGTSPLGSGTTAEQLPAGMWLRTDGDERWLAVSRTRLIRTLACLPDVLTVVLGGQHIPELPLDEVKRFWALLAAEDRSRVRFVHYGPVRPEPGNRPLGHLLADTLGEEVNCYAGIPVGGGVMPDVFTVRPDGSHGWKTFAQVYSYPGGAEPAAPRLRAHREPLPGLPEITPGVYRYAPDAVVEVVAAGLWIRPPEEPAHAAHVRSAPVDVVRLRLFHEAGEAAERMRTVAEEVRDRLEYSTRLAVTLVPVTASSASGPEPTGEPEPEPGSVALPWLARLLATGAFLLPEREPDGEPVPERREGSLHGRIGGEGTLHGTEPEAGARVTADVTEDDRAWLRETWRERFEAEAGQVREVLAANPRLSGRSPEGTLTEALAVRLYLAETAGDDLDAALRSGRAGEHVRFGRCAAAGLARLPVLRGPAVTALTPTERQWELYGENPVLTEWGFLNLLTAPCDTLHGDTELLVWSMSGRRTALLEPVEDPVPGRVVFPPGTRFKVLDRTEPVSGSRGRIVLRELSPSEIDGEGRVDPNRVSLDKFTKASLEKAADRWARSQARERVPSTRAARFRHLPGLVDAR